MSSIKQYREPVRKLLRNKNVSGQVVSGQLTTLAVEEDIPHDLGYVPTRIDVTAFSDGIVWVSGPATSTVIPLTANANLFDFQMWVS